MWLYKEYDNKQKAGQTGKWTHLIHQSIQGQENTSVKGKWFYKGYEKSDEYSGSWTLEMREN